MDAIMIEPAATINPETVAIFRALLNSLPRTYDTII
jgi:hypothetical protein